MYIPFLNGQSDTTPASKTGTVLSMQYTMLHVTPFDSEEHELSELILQKTIYLLSNLCFCIKGSVFPITLWFSEWLSGIHRGS